MPMPYRGRGELTLAPLGMIDQPVAPALIASIAALWTFSEDVWAIILTAMLGEQAEAGLAMYHSLTGSAAQRAALNEMAQRYLDPNLQVMFRALTKRMKGVAGERNTMVHGLWFHDPEIPNALVLAPRNTLSVMFQAGLTDALSALVRGTKPRQFPPTVSFDGWLVYRPSDFVASLGRLSEFVTDQDDLFDKILASRGLPPFGPPARPPLSAP
jgi:hypothetical protein